MKIIISPAKKMIRSDDLAWKNMPVFLDKTEILKKYMQSLSYAEAKALWKCNDKLAEQNLARFADMNLTGNLTPAILAYEGIQYQYMAPGVFESSALAYLQAHLRILSGFYGVLKPMDGIVPYRLEMQAKAEAGGTKDLYEFWGDSLYRELVREDHTILNLASKEYSKCVEKYLTADDRFISVIFGELSDGKIRQKATLAKMARGEMVRYLAENEIQKPEDITDFNRLNFCFHPELSSAEEYVFLAEKRGQEQVKGES